MFERFTDRARKVMALANLEAQRLEQPYVGAEHILLGLVQEGSGVGANVLRNLGVELRVVRREVEKLVKSESEAAPPGKLPMTARAKRIVDNAITEARSLSHNYVGTEHLLLGLLVEHEGVPAQVFASLNLKREVVRAEILNLLGTGGPGEPDVLGGKVNDAVRGVLVRHEVGRAALELEAQIAKCKEEAVQRGAYEQAAQYRDMGKELDFVLLQLAATLSSGAGDQGSPPPAPGGDA
jgi:ATP-dependent Clp protease ATP-binding subunit ClpA